VGLKDSFKPHLHHNLSGENQTNVGLKLSR